MSVNEQLHSLLNEVTHWVMGLIDQHKAIPRVLVGLKSDSSKFAVILSGTPVNESNRDSFIKTILAEENCVMYGYSTVIGIQDEEAESNSEQLVISAASSNEFLYGTWIIERDENNQVHPLGKADVYSGDTPEDQPFTWSLALSEVEEDKKNNLDLWSKMQGRVKRMQAR